MRGVIDPQGSAWSSAWVWGLLVAIGVLGGLGDIVVYQWARGDRVAWLVASCGLHVASVVLFGLLLRWDTRAFCAAFMLSSVVHVVLVVAGDVLVYGRRLSPREWAGMGLAAAAIVLLELGREGDARSKPGPHADSAVLAVATISHEEER